MPCGGAPVGLVVGRVIIGNFGLSVLPTDVLLNGLFAGALSSGGSTEGGGTSGTPEGRLMGVHLMPPGPIKNVTGLL